MGLGLGLGLGLPLSDPCTQPTTPSPTPRPRLAHPAHTPHTPLCLHAHAHTPLLCMYMCMQYGLLAFLAGSRACHRAVARVTPPTVHQAYTPRRFLVPTLPLTHRAAYVCLLSPRGRRLPARAVLRLRGGPRGQAAQDGPARGERHHAIHHTWRSTPVATYPTPTPTPSPTPNPNPNPNQVSAAIAQHVQEISLYLHVSPYISR